MVDIQKTDKPVVLAYSGVEQRYAFLYGFSDEEDIKIRPWVFLSPDKDPPDSVPDDATPIRLAELLTLRVQSNWRLSKNARALLTEEENG